MEMLSLEDGPRRGVQNVFSNLGSYNMNSFLYGLFHRVNTQCLDYVYQKENLGFLLPLIKEVLYVIFFHLIFVF